MEGTAYPPPAKRLTPFIYRINNKHFIIREVIGMKRNRIHAALLCAVMLLSQSVQVQAETGMPPKVVGDLTGDGVMNNVDIIVMQKYILGRLMLPQTLIAELDFNDDGKVNAFDLAVLKRRVAQNREDA